MLRVALLKVRLAPARIQRPTFRRMIHSSSQDLEANEPPRLTVVGIGGAGGNVVNNMVEQEIRGIDIYAANTDKQALLASKVQKKFQLGNKTTGGFGAGAKPEVGRKAAMESLDGMLEEVQGSHILFLAAGMGGGTGTGATPVIAEAAKKAGILTVGMVTTPFHSEGPQRKSIAEKGIEQLEKSLHTLIVIDNQKLCDPANDNISLRDAYKKVDMVLSDGIKSITDLILNPGTMNLDFADLLTIVHQGGRALLGVGEGTGKSRAQVAVHTALYNPLLKDVDFKGAKGVLLHIQGGPDLRLAELNEISEIVAKAVGPRANVIVGHTENPQYTEKVRVSVLVTGLFHKKPQFIEWLKETIRW